MNTRSIIAYLLYPISIITPFAFAADHIRIVAMPGQQAPAFPTGVTFTSLSKATINASGELTFAANLAGPGIVTNGSNTNNKTVWLGTPDNLQLLAQEGQPAPGTEQDTVFATFNNFSDGFESPIAPNSEAAFYATLRGPGVVDGVNDHGIWVGTPGSLLLVARQGDPAPGTQTGTVFATIDHRYAYNDSGAVFYAQLSEPDVIGLDNSIWAGRAGSIQLVARERGDAPDLPPGYSISVGGLSSLSAPLNINSQGGVSFLAETGTQLDGFINTVYAGTPGALEVIARVGQPAPGVADTTFRQFSRNPPTTLNDAGQVSFYDPLTRTAGGLPIPSLWVGTATSLTLAALNDDPAPAPLPPGTVFQALDRKHLLNATGRLAIVATITGPDVTNPNNDVLLTGTPGDWALLARAGDHPPGTEAGVFYADAAFNDPFINSTSEVAFYTSLGGNNKQ